MRRTGNLLTRPYDDYVPSPLLRAIVERRRSPTGICHPVPEVRRAGRRCYAYPWPQMELGDFFVVTIGNRSERALRVAFAQAAARFDYEIAVLRIEGDDGAPALRVTLTVVGVNQWKRLAEADGVSGIRYSDGRWSKRKRDWEQNNRRHGSSSKPVTGPPSDRHFWADGDPELPNPKSGTGPPERKMTREEMLRQALGADGSS